MWAELLGQTLSALVAAADRLLAAPANILGLSSGGLLRGIVAVAVVIGLLIVTLGNLVPETSGPAFPVFRDVMLDPFVAVASVWAAMLLMVSVNRAWSQNEQQRARIAEGHEPTDPDSLPDLRFLALLSAALATALIPAILLISNRYSCQVETSNCLFNVDRAGFEPWVAYSADLIVRVVGFFGVPDVYGLPSPEGIKPNGIEASHLLMFSRLVIGFVVLATLFELYRISSTIGRAARSLKDGPEAATRLGTRATGSLLVHLKENTDLSNDPRIVPHDEPNKVARNASIALGKIGSPKALPTLKAIVEKRSINDWVRRRALDAILAIGRRLATSQSVGWWGARYLAARELKALRGWAQSMLDTETRMRGEAKGVVIEALQDLVMSLVETRVEASATTSAGAIFSSGAKSEFDPAHSSSQTLTAASRTLARPSDTRAANPISADIHPASVCSASSGIA